jgi:hypothetical protein
MHFLAKLLLASFSFFLSAFVAAQQSPGATQASDPSANVLLSKSLAALTGSGPLTDVTLTGTARRVAGSDDESGTGVLKGLASGAGRIDLSLSSGQRGEVQNLSASTPEGSWSGPDGVSHAMAFHNLFTEPAWFFPAFAIARRLSNSAFVATYIGHETRDGQAVEHISVSQTAPSQGPPGAPTFPHLTQVDFFLDATTLLPVAIAFNVHPDNNAGLDLPVEIRFSDYRAVNGAQVPYHVQKYLKNSLLLDFQATNVTLNSGLSATNFTVESGL